MAQDHAVFDGFEDEVLQRSDCRLDMVRTERHLPLARLVDRRTHFGRGRLRQVFATNLVLLANAMHQLETLCDAPLRVFVEGPSRGGDRAIDVGRAAGADPGEGLFGRRVDHVDRGRLERVDPGAVDVKLEVIGHKVTCAGNSIVEGEMCREAPALASAF